MPLFEAQYGGRTDIVGTRMKPVSGQDALQLAGAHLQIVVSVTQEHADAMTGQGREPPNPISGIGLIDTGASMTAVEEGVCRELGLSPTATASMAHAAGIDERPCYPIQVLFPGTPIAARVLPTAVSVRLATGDQRLILLLGRDFLSTLRMVYNGPAGRIELAW